MPRKLILNPPAVSLVRVALALSVLALFAARDPAAAQQDARALQQRIERLESDLSILQRQVYSGGGAPSSSSGASGAIAPTVAASLEVRVSQLEDQMQSLTGRIEEINHSIEVLKAQFDKLSKDVDFRLSAVEHGGAPPVAGGASGSAPGGNPPASMAAVGGNEPPPAAATPLPGGQVLPVGTSQQQYDYARALLVQQDYANAEKSFSAFIASHPNDTLAGPAQYWLGETYYVRGNYDQAAKVFAEGYQKYPKSSKAPDTLLKLGMSLAQLKRTKDACVLYNELRTRYPNAPANVKQLAQRERQRSGCS